MKKVIISITVLTSTILVLTVAYIMLPWTGMYLYGEFAVEEPKKPQKTLESFPFTLVYELNGKKIVIEDTMVCKYTGSEWYGEVDTKSRTWGMELESGGDAIVLWEGKNKKGEEQKVIWGVSPEYYMGDVNDDGEYKEPDKDDILYPGMTEDEYRNLYIELQTMASDGVPEEEGISKKELLKYGIKIISWKCRQPIKNKFVD